MTTALQAIRFGLIGCGAAAQELHLPFLLGRPGILLDWVVDADRRAAERLSAKYGIPHAGADYCAVADVDAVIVATPHHLHAPMCRHFLGRGVHVLCEKPLATKHEDAEALVELARTRNRVLAVGVFRRYYPASVLVRAAIENEWLGPVVEVDAEEGGAYGWNLRSRFMMERDKAGGGVLMDTGAHTVDRILWWLGDSDPELEDYRDDSETGVEAECEVRFQVPWRGAKIPVRVELSRTRTLRNTFRVRMRDGCLEVPANEPTAVWLESGRFGLAGGAAARLRLDVPSFGGFAGNKVLDFFGAQLDDFCAAIREGRQPLNSGLDGVRIVRFFETCYARRRPYEEPWMMATGRAGILGAARVNGPDRMGVSQ